MVKQEFASLRALLPLKRQKSKRSHLNFESSLRASLYIPRMRGKLRYLYNMQHTRPIMSGCLKRLTFSVVNLGGASFQLLAARLERA